jgi:WD40 repeat protein
VFAPDGGRILTASDDNTARLWDRDGKPLAILQGHAGRVNSAVFAPDGGRILTASRDTPRDVLTALRDGTARLWDRDGKLLATLEGHTDGVISAVFGPDGGRILTASDDNTAKRKVGQACSRLTQAFLEDAPPCRSPDAETHQRPSYTSCRLSSHHSSNRRCGTCHFSSSSSEPDTTP